MERAENDRAEQIRRLRGEERGGREGGRQMRGEGRK